MNGSEAYHKITCHFMGSTNEFSTAFEKFLISHILAAFVNGIFIIPTVLLNAVSIVTILKSSQLKSKPCYFIILVQSVIDLAVGVLGIPLFLVYLIQGITGTSNCFGTFLARRSTTLPLGVSIITLLAMTMERYIAILHPYAYSTKVTKKRILVCVGSGTVVTFFVIILSLAIPSAILMFAVLLVAVVFLFTVFAYTKIYLVVRKLNRPPNQLSDAESQGNLTRKKLFLREIKQAKSCFIVVMCFFILSFLPPTMLSLSRNTDNGELLAKHAWLYMVSMFNSSVNSVIFFWSKTMLRKEAKKRLSFICAR